MREDILRFNIMTMELGKYIYETMPMLTQVNNQNFNDDKLVAYILKNEGIQSDSLKMDVLKKFIDQVSLVKFGDLSKYLDGYQDIINKIVEDLKN